MKPSYHMGYTRVRVLMRSQSLSLRTFIELLSKFDIQIYKNEDFSEADRLRCFDDNKKSDTFLFSNEIFYGMDFIKREDAKILKEFVRERRDGRKFLLGEFYHKKDNRNLFYRLIDYRKEGTEIIYKAEFLASRWRGMALINYVEIKDDDIGLNAESYQIETPYLDSNIVEDDYWIEPIRNEKIENDFF